MFVFRFEDILDGSRERLENGFNHGDITRAVHCAIADGYSFPVSGIWNRINDMDYEISNRTLRQDLQFFLLNVFRAIERSGTVFDQLAAIKAALAMLFLHLEL